MAENIPTYPDLAGKVALVTGWSGGIGAATCLLLASNGVKRAGPRASTKQPEGAISMTESDREPSPMPHLEVRRKVLRPTQRRVSTA
jgi:NAD(P)-dependent dehydrogenase (short-subunit alcohol dehydrogenase family)